MRILGIDPGLRATGWGVVEQQGNRLFHIANGTVKTLSDRPVPDRLVALHDGLRGVIADHQPEGVAVEITLANKNPDSTLKLGMARGIALSVPALCGLPVEEYLPMIVKKSVVGTGHGGKEQVQMMVTRLLPGCEIHSPDSADALAVAICHIHNLATGLAWSRGMKTPPTGALTHPKAARKVMGWRSFRK